MAKIHFIIDQKSRADMLLSQGGTAAKLDEHDSILNADAVLTMDAAEALANDADALWESPMILYTGDIVIDAHLFQYTIVMIRTGAEVVQPMVILTDPTMIQAQDVGNETPSFYLFPVDCEYDLHGGRDISNENIGAVVTELIHELRTIEQIENRNVLSSSSQLLPQLFDMISNRIGSVAAPVTDSDPELMGIFDARNDTEIVSISRLLPELRDILAVEDKPIHPFIVCDDAILAKIAECRTNHVKPLMIHNDPILAHIVFAGDNAVIPAIQESLARIVNTILLNASKTVPFLFDVDALIADTVKTEFFGADSLLFSVDPLVADGLLTDTDVTGGIAQNTTSKNADAQMLYASHKAPFVIVADPYVPICVYTGQETVQPMVTDFTLLTAKGQLEGFERPALYLFPTYCAHDLHEEHEVCGANNVSANVMADHKMQATEKAAYSVVQPFNVMAGAAQGDALAFSLNGTGVFLTNTAPRIVDDTKIRSDVMEPLPTYTDWVAADATKSGSIATNPFSQKIDADMAGLEEVSELQTLAMSIVAAPGYLFGAFGEYHAIAPALIEMVSSLLDAQKIQCERALLPSAPVMSAAVLDDITHGDTSVFVAAANEIDPSLYSGEKTSLSGTPTGTAIADGDYSSANKAEAADVIGGCADLEPKTNDVTYTENSLVQSLLAYGTSRNADGLFSDTKTTNPLINEGTMSVIGMTDAYQQQVAIMSILISPHYLYGEYGSYEATQALIVNAISALISAQHEGMERGNAHTAAALCEHNMIAGKESSLTGLVSAESELDYELADAMQYALRGGVYFSAHTMPSQMETEKSDFSDFVLAFIGAEYDTGQVTRIEHENVNSLMVFGETRDIGVTKSNVTEFILSFVYAAYRTIEVSDSADTVMNVVAALYADSTQNRIDKFDSKQMVSPSVFVLPSNQYVSDGGYQSVQAIFGQYHPELHSVQFVEHDSPTLYAVAISCVSDFGETSFSDSDTVCASMVGMEYDLSSLLKQRDVSAASLELDIVRSICEMLSQQTRYAPLAAYQMLMVDQKQTQAFHTADVFGYCGLLDVQYKDILRFLNRSAANGAAVLSPSFVDVLDTQISVRSGGLSVTEHEFKDSHPVHGEGMAYAISDTRPVTRLPVEVSCGVCLTGANHVERTPGVFEFPDLDSAHVTTIDLLPATEIDWLPVRAEQTDGEQHYYRYQLLK